MEDQDRAYLQFRTHAVTVVKSELGRVHCFKFTAEQCDWETFPDYPEAVEWILQPFPAGRWELKLDS